MFRVVMFAVIALFSTGALAAATEKDNPIPQPVGARVGSFMLYPSVKLMENFDSNIYGTVKNEESDFITTISPGLLIKNTDNDVGGTLNLMSQNGFYAANSGENYNDYMIDFSPFVVMTRAMKLTAKLSHEQAHDIRTDENGLADPSAAEPTIWQRSIGRLGWEYKRSRFGAATHAQITTYRFDNVDNKNAGGPSFIANDRDRNELQGGVELTCDIGGKSTSYWRNLAFHHDYQRRDYDTGTLSYSGDARDSSGAASVVGFKFPITDLITADINAGYHDQDFKAPGFTDMGDAIGRAALSYQVSRLFLVGLSARRQLLETPIEESSGFKQDAYALDFTYDASRQWQFDSTLSLWSNDYYGINRNDDYIMANIGATYHLNRMFSIRPQYMFDTRDSSIAGADYNRHRVFMSLRVRF
jgi:hypothetical protein